MTSEPEGGAGASAPGGAGNEPMGGAGGVAGTSCHSAADCTNSDPTDGEELCTDGMCMAGNPPPTVVSITPIDKAKTADPAGTIVITFSEPVDPTSVKPSIQLFDGTTAVAGTVAVDGSKATFKPALPLVILAGYKVSVQNTVKDVEGAAMLAPFTSTFMVRDGAWATTAAVSGRLDAISDTLPITADGSALLAWADGQDGCAARWFLPGKDLPVAKKLSDATATSCNGISAAATAAGVAAVVWGDPDCAHGLMASQFRNNAWQASATQVAGDIFLSLAHVAVSPTTGMVTIIAHRNGVASTAWRTDAKGVWIAQGDPLSTDYATSAASIAFDAAGNGLAVWSAVTAENVSEMLFSRYTTSSGKWIPAAKIPDSQATLKNRMLGAPTLAMNDAGDGEVVWMQDVDDSAFHVVASSFSHGNGTWSANHTDVSGHLTDPRFEAPALVFDGKGFVAAWLAAAGTTPGACANADCVYTNRSDIAGAKWGSPITQQSVASDVSATRMPVLATDRRGNLMLVWAKPASAGAVTLVYERYLAGKWSGIIPLPGGTVADNNFTIDPLALSMNASGMAALSWANHDISGTISSIQLARFF